MGRRKKAHYKEGDWFAVTLRKPGVEEWSYGEDGYAVGLITRMSKDNEVFGYFFGPKRAKVPSLEEVLNYKLEDAIYLAMFGEAALDAKKWPIIGSSPAWDRTKWPFPIFGHIDTVDNKGYKRIYDEDELGIFEDEIPCSVEEAKSLPEDGLDNAAAVEGVLTMILHGMPLPGGRGHPLT